MEDNNSSLSFLEKQDIFGYQIVLKANKHSSTHNTKCGGIISIVFKLALLTYFCLNIQTMLNYRKNYIKDQTYILP